jgi:rubrerythrin
VKISSAGVAPNPFQPRWNGRARVRVAVGPPPYNRRTPMSHPSTSPEPLPEPAPAGVEVGRRSSSFGLTAALARALNPLVWRRPGHVARKLHGFALAEHGSMLDLRLAARLTPSPERAAAYLRHADDETRHAQMFAKRARQLAREAQLPPLGHVRADSEQLFVGLGELDFLAFVHVGEARAIAQFQTYVRFFRARGREREASLFSAILVDEQRHADYTRELLYRLAGSEAEARRALRRVRRWEAWRSWLRAGRFLAEKVYVLAMLLVYLLSAPLGLLVRWARPVRRGWRSLESADDPQPEPGRPQPVATKSIVPPGA